MISNSPKVRPSAQKVLIKIKKIKRKIKLQESSIRRTIRDYRKDANESWFKENKGIILKDVKKVV